jgi:hypothetical protein
VNEGCYPPPLLDDKPPEDPLEDPDGCSQRLALPMVTEHPHATSPYNTVDVQHGVPDVQLGHDKALHVLDPDDDPDPPDEPELLELPLPELLEPELLPLLDPEPLPLVEPEPLDEPEPPLKPEPQLALWV